MLPEAVRSRVAFVSVSVDPERDTPLALKDFATRLGIDFGTWTFVTGSGTLRLADEYKAEVTRDDEGQIDHRAAVFLLDANGRLAQTYTGAPIDRRRLAREIEILDRSPTRRTSSEGRLSQRTP
jgi:protein SCO1/2